MQQPLLNKTQAHYDSYPFIEGGSDRVAWWRDYLLDFLPDAEIKDKLMIDVGSSVGEISRGLLDRGVRMACVDVSRQSLERCAVNNPEAAVFHGNALKLPFADESFDHAISIGVLHHTPDCRRGFHEAARVLAPGGRFVIFLYNYWNVYNLIYNAWKPIRATVPLERVPKWMVHTMQPFARTHLGQTLDTDQLRRLLGDKLWTPQATFHKVSEIRRWGREEGLELEATKKFYLGYANVMLLRKAGQPDGVRREVGLVCQSCLVGTAYSAGDTFVCTACGHSYDSSNGVVECMED